MRNVKTYGDLRKCLNCGEPVYWSSGGTSGCDMWLHLYDRWEGDNGYWCTNQNTTSADGREARERDFYDTYPVTMFQDGEWVSQNPTTKEVVRNPFMNSDPQPPEGSRFSAAAILTDYYGEL